MQWLAFSLLAVSLCALTMSLWRTWDIRADRKVWTDLLQMAGTADTAFDPSVVADLPEPARRYFRYTITPGARLVSAVEIEMGGQLGLGTKDNPGYRPMSAHQILVPPHGLVWQVRTGPISGSDVATPVTSWTRFWLANLIPVVRSSGNPDHHRSAFGRVVAEGAFWLPSSLLPGDCVTWKGVDENTARAIVTYGGYSQSIDLTMEADGRPHRVLIQRWSNENSEKVFREQPFGGYLSDFREIAGYRLPMRVEGGNLIGTDEYFPFYQAQVRTFRFPQLEQ